MPRPELECCRAQTAHAPSGLKWVHSSRCKLYPRQVVGDERTPERLALLRTRLDHPAGKSVGGDASLRVWFKHEPGCGCEDCGYVEHWMDRDDADGFPTGVEAP